MHDILVNFSRIHKLICSYGISVTELVREGGNRFALFLCLWFPSIRTTLYFRRSLCDSGSSCKLASNSALMIFQPPMCYMQSSQSTVEIINVLCTFYPTEKTKEGSLPVTYSKFVPSNLHEMCREVELSWNIILMESSCLTSVVKLSPLLEVIWTNNREVAWIPVVPPHLHQPFFLRNDGLLRGNLLSLNRNITVNEFFWLTNTNIM